jgi:hypothetical protein
MLHDSNDGHGAQHLAAARSIAAARSPPPPSPRRLGPLPTDTTSQTHGSRPIDMPRTPAPLANSSSDPDDLQAAEAVDEARQACPAVVQKSSTLQTAPAVAQSTAAAPSTADSGSSSTADNAAQPRSVADDATASDEPRRCTRLMRGPKGFGLRLSAEGLVEAHESPATIATQQPPVGARIVGVNGTSVDGRAAIIAQLRLVSVSQSRDAVELAWEPPPPTAATASDEPRRCTRLTRGPKGFGLRLSAEGLVEAHESPATIATQQPPVGARIVGVNGTSVDGRAAIVAQLRLVSVSQSRDAVELAWEPPPPAAAHLLQEAEEARAVAGAKGGNDLSAPSRLRGAVRAFLEEQELSAFESVLASKGIIELGDVDDMPDAELETAGMSTVQVRRVRRARARARVAQVRDTAFQDAEGGCGNDMAAGRLGELQAEVAELRRINAEKAAFDKAQAKKYQNRCYIQDPPGCLFRCCIPCCAVMIHDGCGCSCILAYCFGCFYTMCCWEPKIKPATRMATVQGGPQMMTMRSSSTALVPSAWGMVPSGSE